MDSMQLINFFVHAKSLMTVVHVLSVVIGMGAALVSDTLFTFYSSDKVLSKNEKKTLAILSAVVWWGLILITISGIGLFLSNISKYLHSIKFLTKMTILLVLVINGTVLNHIVWPHVIKRGFFVNKKESHIRKLAFACGAVSVISWIAVCTLGVLDSVSLSYGTLIYIYVSILVLGVSAALVIESYRLERDEIEKR